MYGKTNHLSNTLVTISDNKVGVSSSNANLADFYEARVLSATDYYAFGMAMKERSFQAESYRYGFNGKEKDGDIGEEISDFDARLLNKKIGRWTATDPHESKYSFISTYAFSLNSPLMFNDPDGKDVKPTTREAFNYIALGIHPDNAKYLVWNEKTLLIEISKNAPQNTNDQNFEDLKQMVKYTDMTVVVNTDGQVRYKHKDGSVRTIPFKTSTTEIDRGVSGITQVPGGEVYSNGGGVRSGLEGEPRAIPLSLTGSATEDIEIFLNPLAGNIATESLLLNGKVLYGEINKVTTIAHELYVHAYLFMLCDYDTQTEYYEGQSRFYTTASYNHGGGSAQKQKEREKRQEVAERTAEINYREHISSELENRVKRRGQIQQDQTKPKNR